MKKLVIMIVVALFAMAACGDKIQTAKTVLAFVNLGAETAKGAIKTVAEAKKAECLKLGAEDSEPFKKCYAETAKLLEAVDKIYPRLDLAMQNAAKYIKAAESGEAGDYAGAVKQTVCLLTEIAQVIPGEGWAKLKKKIEMYLALASAYTCEKKTSTIAPATGHQLYVLKQGLKLMKEIRGVQG